MKIASDDLSILEDVRSFFFEGDLPFSITPKEAKPHLEKAIKVIQKYPMRWESVIYPMLLRSNDILGTMEDKPAHEQIKLMGIDSDMAAFIRFIQNY